MLSYIFLLEDIFAFTATNQLNNSVIRMNGFASIAKHELIRCISALHAEKNWFEIYRCTFHFPVSVKFTNELNYKEIQTV